MRLLASSFLRWLTQGGDQRGSPALNSPQALFKQVKRVALLDVAGDHENRVARPVVLSMEVNSLLKSQSLQIVHGADNRVGVGPVRIGQLIKAQMGTAVGSVIVALLSLLDDRLALVFKVGGCDA